VSEDGRERGDLTKPSQGVRRKPTQAIAIKAGTGHDFFITPTTFIGGLLHHFGQLQGRNLVKRARSEVP
jgi:hypothetical protein